MDLGDAFTYLSCSHIMSTSNFRIREKKFQIFHFYAYFLKGNFKELPEKLFSARFQLFFHRILKIFLISKTISTWSLEMFYDLPEQVFILNYDVWMRFRWNRSNSQTRADPDYQLCVALHWSSSERWLTRCAMFPNFERFWRKRIQTSKTKMKTCSASSKNTSRTQVDMVFDIRKIFRIRRKNFVKWAENSFSTGALKFPL